MPADELQRATLASLGMVFAEIATVDDVIDMIRSSSPVAAVSSCQQLKYAVPTWPEPPERESASSYVSR